MLLFAIVFFVILVAALALGAYLLSVTVPALLVDPSNVLAWLGLIVALYCVKVIIDTKVEK